MSGKHHIRRAMLGQLEKRLAARFELQTHGPSITLINRATMQVYDPADVLQQITAAEYVCYEADSLGREAARAFTQQWPDGPQVS